MEPVSYGVEYVFRGKWDKFGAGLKPKIAFEVRKHNCMEFKEATRIALRFEAAMNVFSNGRSSYNEDKRPFTMNTGNVQTAKIQEAYKGNVYAQIKRDYTEQCLL